MERLGPLVWATRRVRRLLVHVVAIAAQELP
jgi:hypothetical protein